MLYVLIVCALIAADQGLKAWTVSHLALGESAPFLPGLMRLTRLHNYGAAWSSFSGRTALLIIAGIVILLAAFVTADKFAWPDADLLFFLPEGAHQLVNEEVLGNTTTTTTEPTTVTTTAPTTTLPAGHYAPIEEFALEKSKKGNLLGNILQGGKAWHDSEYIYHIVDGDGIYRFYPGTETFTRIYASADKLANLNITEKLLYFTDTYFVKYRFTGCTHIMAECNYSKEALQRSVAAGYIPIERVPRLMRSHMSLEHLKDMLQANDLSRLQQIYLLHLSADNSDEMQMQQEIQRLTGVEVYVC